MTTDTTITTAATENTEHTEMIIYQGQPVQATLVNHISGDISTSTTDVEGDEELFRDEAGRYYLRRTLNWRCVDRATGRGVTRASGRTLVHRLNVNAAILWATTRLNSDTLDLRCDAANLLMEGREYFDPHPSHLSAKRRALLADSSRFAISPATDHTSRPVTMDALSEEVTVAVKMPLALYRQVLAMTYYDSDNTSLDVGARIVECVEGDVEAWREAGAEEARYLSEFERELDAGQHPEVYPLPQVLAGAAQPAPGLADLDEHTRGLLAEFVAEHPGCHPRDAFNGVLAQILECELRDRSEYTDVFVAEARERRLAQEQAGKASGKSAAPGRVLVELDELASTMLRRVCRHGSECRKPGEDPRDLVNAAVTYYLCGDDNSQQGEFDLNDGGDALERAKGDRLNDEREALTA